MRKRDQQKFVVVSIVLGILFIFPIVQGLSQFQFQVFGFPAFYAIVFAIWLSSVGITFYLLKRYDK